MVFVQAFAGHGAAGLDTVLHPAWPVRNARVFHDIVPAQMSPETAMAKPVIFTISAAWDDEARVWTGHCDDIPAAALVTPALTTVSQFQEQLGRRAAELLLERFDGLGLEGGRSVEMPAELVVRESA